MYSTVSFGILVMADSACGIGMGSHAGLLLAQRGASGGSGRIWGDIFNMAGWSWCILMGHRTPQSTTQKSWPVICCRTGMLWATRELLTSFYCTTTAHLTHCDWLRLNWFQPRRQVCCVRGWLGSHGVQSRLRHTRLNKSDQNASLAYQGPWVLNVWSHLKPQLKWNITVIGINEDITRYLQWGVASHQSTHKHCHPLVPQMMLSPPD